MAKSKIRINPVTMEIEIEVSDTFLEKYFEKLTNRFPKAKKLTPKIKTIKTIKTKPSSKIKKGIKKAKTTPVVKGERGSIQDGILERIKMGKDGGVSVGEIVDSTGLKKIQIYNAIKVLKSKGIIKTTGRGNYIYTKS